MSARGVQAVSQIRQISSCEATSRRSVLHSTCIGDPGKREQIITALVVEYSTTLYRADYSVTRNATEAEGCEPLLSADRHGRSKLSLRSEGIDGDANQVCDPNCSAALLPHLPAVLVATQPLRKLSQILERIRPQTR